MQSYAFIGSTSSLPRGGAPLAALPLVGRSLAPAAPLRLAIYYGYPSLVNDARGDLARAVAAFSPYDIIVFGDGLEVDGVQEGRGAGAEEHAFATATIHQLHRTRRRREVYGYVDIGRTQQLTLDEVLERLDGWARMGAAGVLLDEAGYDFGVTRDRQNAAIAAAHSRGLRVCLNAFDPDDVFGAAPVPLNAAGGGNPDGVTPLVSEHDALLLESFAVRDSMPEDIGRLLTRTRAALDGRAWFGTRILAVSTGAGRDHDAALAQYGWWTASALGLDAYGWGMPVFSAVTSRLPWIARPDAERKLRRA